MSKLQIKPGQSVAVLGKPDDVQLDVEAGADTASADSVLVFVTTSGDLLGAHAQAALAAAQRDALAWVAYPKGGKLGTDLNRDRLAAALSERGVRPVRQIAIDDTWSALRFRPGD
jgi:phage-related baseplate assembly protein